MILNHLKERYVITEIHLGSHQHKGRNDKGIVKRQLMTTEKGGRLEVLWCSGGQTKKELQEKKAEPVSAARAASKMRPQD